MWLHGDLHSINVLTAERSIRGVFDFGDICAGDPACDLSDGWLLLSDRVMDRFHQVYGSADATTLMSAQLLARRMALACLITGDKGAKGLRDGSQRGAASQSGFAAAHPHGRLQPRPPLWTTWLIRDPTCFGRRSIYEAGFEHHPATGYRFVAVRELV